MLKLLVGHETHFRIEGIVILKKSVCNKRFRGNPGSMAHLVEWAAFFFIESKGKVNFEIFETCFDATV